MQLVRQPIEPSAAELPEVELVADRFKLQKRRWRGQAEDGSDFGFELSEPLEHGAFVRRMGVVIHLAAHALAWLQNVTLGEGHRVGAPLREEIATKERARALLEEKTAFPSVG